uniref:Uncharacterized protein n=1 Tax=Tanacetum cinerariifolium TaxID=118510 RepID=A0A699HXR6_TANCI|nr:hypothetical protein [Tanacetum cinerariifolium]
MRLYKIGLFAKVESSTKEQSIGDEDASKQGRNIANIDAYAKITLVDETIKDKGRYDDQELFDTSVLDDEEEVILKEAQDVQNVIEKQEARRLQAKFDEKDKLAEEKAQLIEDENLAWNNVQAMIDVDYALVARLQEEEQGELTIEEKSRLFVELMDKRKKAFCKTYSRREEKKTTTQSLKEESNVGPVDDMDSFLMHTMKTMFEHQVKDTVWRSQQGLSKVKSRKLFDYCGVYYVTM